MIGWLPALTVLSCLLACNDRDFGPLDSNGDDPWTKDGNRNGIADSVEVYAPDCDADPDTCLALAHRNQSILANLGKDTTDHGKNDGKVRVPDSIAVQDLALEAGAPAVPPRLTWYPAEVPDKRYSLISDNAMVAGIDAGNIKPLSGGTARVTVITESGRLVKTFTVTVKAKPKPPDPIDKTIRVISVSAKPLTLYVGDEAPAILAWNPANPTDTGYALVSQDPEKAVIQGGRVVAKAPGTANILVTARDGGKTASFTVTVQEKDTRIRVITVAVRDTIVSLGQDAEPLITWTPADATEKGYKLMSADPSLVSVSEGRFRGEAPGTATLILQAKDDPSRTAAFKVKVVVPLHSVTAPDMALTMGEAPRAATLAWVPEQASDKRYRLTSDNPRIAAVVQDTLVQAVAPGSARITLTAMDGERKHEFLAVVSALIIPVQSIAVKDLTLDLGGTDTEPSITWTPADATDKGYSLAAAASADPAVSIVENKVHALKAGTHAVLVTPAGGGQAVSFQVTVIAHVDSITALDMTLADDGKGTAPQLTWFPADASDKTFSMTSTNPSVVSVQGPSLFGSNVGRCVVSVTTADGNRRAAFNVRVIQRKCLEFIQENAQDSTSQDEIKCCNETGKVCRNNQDAAGIIATE